MYSLLLDTLCQRVLNDLWRTRLSRRRMIWLLPHPLPHPLPPPISKFSIFLSLPLYRRSSLLTEGGGGNGQGKGAKSYDGGKACSSINHSLISADLCWNFRTIYGGYRNQVCIKGCHTGPSGYIGWQNRFLGIDFWAP